MFDIGLTEMMVIGVVALIVVGPKDLPKMFHTLGQVTGKARGMAREFQRAMDSAARETGVNDIVKDFKRTTSGKGLKEATGLGDLEKDFRDIGDFDGGKPVTKPGATAKGKPVMPPKAVPADELTPEELADMAEPDFDPDAIAEQDLARRNTEISATEAARIKRQKQAEAARLKAAGLRAQREAKAAEAAAAEPAAASAPTPAKARKTAPQQPETDS